MSAGGTATVAVWRAGVWEHKSVARTGNGDRTVIRVLTAGVCGSDLHVIGHAAGELALSGPLSLGHEIVGEVVRAGRATRVLGGEPIRRGDRVVVVPGVPCGACPVCLSLGSHEHLCEQRAVHGFGTYAHDREFPVGGFSTEIELLEGIWVQPLGAGISEERAALGELVSVAVRAVERGLAGGRPEVGMGALVGASAAVIGVGPVGACVGLVLQYLGVKVQGFERNSWRRRHAEERLGLEVAPGAGAGEPWNDGETYDVVFECAGEPEAFVAALRLARRGGRVVELGHFFPNGTAAVDPSVICRKDLDVIGSVLAPPTTYPKAVAVLSAQSLPFDEVVTDRIPLPDVAVISALVEDRDHMKALVVPSG
jgi:threonine dehydrogenase-like Zn-dependent dehydrogenase